MKDGYELEAEMELPPLRYGESLIDSAGRKTFSTVNVFLFKDRERQETGPTLYTNSRNEKLKGYCQTIGMEGEFESTFRDLRYLNHPMFGVAMEISLRKRFFGEVENVKVDLVDPNTLDKSPSEFSFGVSCSSYLVISFTFFHNIYWRVCERCHGMQSHLKR